MPTLVHRRLLQTDEELMGQARNKAVVPTGAAPLDTDFLGCLYIPAATAEHLLQRADERADVTDTVAKKISDDRRANSLGPAVVFQKGPGAGRADPDIPEIRARFHLDKTRRNRIKGQKRQGAASKEQ
jgi:hypothetical protein